MTGDPARSRATSRPALSRIAISASASAALSVRTESAQSWRAAASSIRPITRSAAGGVTFLSLGRARALLAAWVVGLAAFGALRPGPPRRRVARVLLGPIALLALGGAAATLPRSVPRLVTTDSALTVIDYHAHTSASHDGRRGWTALDLARWHAAQGFEASYVTDHNVLFDQRVQQPIPLLPGVEWSVAGQHVVALADTLPIDRGRFDRDTRSLLALFGELHRHGALG